MPVSSIDADRDLRQLVAFAQPVNDALRAVDAAVDELAEFWSAVTIERVEAFDYNFGFVMIFREDDGLAQLVTRVDFHAGFHEVVEHDVDGANVDGVLVGREHGAAHVVGCVKRVGIAIDQTEFFFHLLFLLIG